MWGCAGGLDEIPANVMQIRWNLILAEAGLDHGSLPAERTTRPAELRAPCRLLPATKSIAHANLAHGGAVLEARI